MNLLLFDKNRIMKKKNIILLALGYLGGLAIATKYSKKNSIEVNKELSENKDKKFFDVFIENVIDIHKQFVNYIEVSIKTEENMKKIEDLKSKVIDEVEQFKKEAIEKTEELKQKWIQKKEEIEKEIATIYEKRQEYLNKAKDNSLTYIEDWKKKLEKVFDEIKEKIK